MNLDKLWFPIMHKVWWELKAFQLKFLSIRTFQDPYAKKFMKDIKRTETSYIAKSGSILVSIHMYLRKQLQKYQQFFVFLAFPNLENQLGQNSYQEFAY